MDWVILVVVLHASGKVANVYAFSNEGDAKEAATIVEDDNPRLTANVLKVPIYRVAEDFLALLQ